jgi:cytochrome c-type biogenesis protein CcmE
LIAGATGYMAYVGAASSWQYYVTVDECLAGAGRMAGDRVRVSGKISPSSLRIADDRQEAHFALAGKAGKLAVSCRGPLPDNLAEGVEVVVEGRLDDGGVLRGEKVLTRCAGKYRSLAGAGTAQGGRPAGPEEGR